MVLADGFTYDGKSFGNLSEIAVLITGTRWNGPRFFGLRSKAAESGELANANAKPSKGAKPKVGVATPARHLGGGRDYRKRNADIAAKSGSKAARHGAAMTNVVHFQPPYSCSQLIPLLCVRVITIIGEN